MTPVLIRTYSAGVHFGYLVDRSEDGKRVKLTKSRRIWRWAGANTLSEIATAGLDIENSRVAVPVDIELTEAIEIIQVTPQAEENLNNAVWGN